MVSSRVLMTFLMILSCAPLPRAWAAEAFFEALYDVPVMPGLEEIKEQAMLFDKPGGRIASVVAAARDIRASAISAFYADVLPELGWKKVSANQYVRGEDRLVIDLVERPSVTAVHITLSPAAP